MTEVNAGELRRLRRIEKAAHMLYVRADLNELSQIAKTYPRGGSIIGALNHVSNRRLADLAIALGLLEKES